MIGDLVLVLIGVVVGLLLLVVLVAVLVRPPLRRFARATAALRLDVGHRRSGLRALGAAVRRHRRAPIG